MGKAASKKLVEQIKELKEMNQALRAALALLGGKVKIDDDGWRVRISVPLPQGYAIIQRRHDGFDE